MAGKKIDSLTQGQIAGYVKRLRAAANSLNDVSRQMREEHNAASIDVVGKAMAGRGMNSIETLVKNCGTVLSEMDLKKERASRQTVSGES
jgi:hypothetical protein